MTIAILIITALILVLVTPSAILWIWLSITLLRNEKEAHKKLLEMAETEKKVAEQTLQSNHREN